MMIKIKELYYLKMTHILQDRKWHLVTPLPKYIKEFSDQETSVSSAAISPMPGVVDKILVKKGDVVKSGDPLIVIVAMKMEVCKIKIT